MRLIAGYSTCFGQSETVQNYFCCWCCFAAFELDNTMYILASPQCLTNGDRGVRSEKKEQKSRNLFSNTFVQGFANTKKFHMR